MRLLHRSEIVAIALPAIISNLTTPVLGLVDVAITGHIGNAVYIGAIAVGGTIFNMLYWLFNFLRMGSSGLTAQAYGAGNRSRCDTILFRALIIGVAVGLVLIALSRPICSVVLGFMDADGDTAALADSYFRICIWGAPAVMASYAIMGWFVGMQDSRSAMWVSVFINVANIVTSLVLVFGLGWKIEGVATGTLTAQWAGVLLGAVIIMRRYRPALQPLRKVLERHELLSFFRINADIFLRTCCLVTVTLWFTHAGALQGPVILAANAVLLQLFILFSYFMDGFAYAGEALAGKYAGALQARCNKDADRGLKSLIRELLLSGVLCALVFSVIYLIAGEAFVSVLTEDCGVVECARRYLPWCVAVPLCGFLAFLWDGIFVGLTYTRYMLAAMSVALIVFFALYFSLHSHMGNHCLWLAFDAYLIVRGLVSWCLYLRRVRS